jgi:hypothetical protein
LLAGIEFSEPLRFSSQSMIWIRRLNSSSGEKIIKASGTKEGAAATASRSAS